MQLEDKISIIEAILFATGEPVSADVITACCDIEAEALPKLVKMLNDRYDNTASALKVLKLGENYQLATRQEFSSYIKSALENRRSMVLSSAAMEVLTIVAYNQPVSKSFVESVRGIDSSSIVNALVEKELLQEAGRLDVPGKPVSYKTTDNFLRCFGLSSIEDLPQLPSHNDQVSFDEVKDETNTVNV